jgi:hypothetical protein
VGSPPGGRQESQRQSAMVLLMKHQKGNWVVSGNQGKKPDGVNWF